MPMTFYVRRRGRDTWHWMRNCHFMQAFRKAGFTKTWRAGVDHTLRDTRPRTDLCNECRSKEKQQKKS